jgi:hypothetical protein
MRAPYDHEPISLRDHIAISAMNGLIEGYDHEARCKSHDPKARTGLDDFMNADSETTFAYSLAWEAYMLADAMLQVRREARPEPTRVDPDPKGEEFCDE